MTGERELPEGEMLINGGGGEVEEERIGSGGGGVAVKKPTWRTFGSITAREVRRGSMEKIRRPGPDSTAI